MRRRHLVKMVVFGLAWSVIVALCIGQTDDEGVFPESGLRKPFTLMQVEGFMRQVCGSPRVTKT